MLAKIIALFIASWLVMNARARLLLAGDLPEQASQKPEASAKEAPEDSTTLQGPIGSEADLTELDRKAAWSGMVTGEGALFYIFIDSIHPTWSPDGKTILLRKLDHERVPFGGRKVWSFDAATLQPKLVTHCWSNEFSPEYSPDGKSISFVSDRPLPEPAKPGQLGLNLWIMNADGSNPRPLTACFRSLYSAVWSPDGTRLLLTTTTHNPPVGGGGWAIDNSLYVLDPTRRTLRRIGPVNGRAVLSSFWLKKGSEVGFISASLSDDWEETPPSSSLMVLNPDGSGSASFPCDPGLAVPSPDGESLLVRSCDVKGKKDRIAILDLEGHEKKVVFASSDRNERGLLWDTEVFLLHGIFFPHMTWSPDGSKVAFAVSRNGKIDVLTANCDGSDLRGLVKGPEQNCTPIWSRDGKKVLFFSYPTLADFGIRIRNHIDIAVVNADGSDLHRFTDSAAIMDQERKDLQECLARTKDPVEAGRIRERLGKVGY